MAAVVYNLATSESVSPHRVIPVRETRRRPACGRSLLRCKQGMKRERGHSMNEKLLINGDVAHPGNFDQADLAQIAPTDQIDDVGQIVQGRQGRAIKLPGLMKLVGVHPTARFLGLHASRDDFHASISLEAVKPRGYLVFEFEGQPLPVDRGGPFRFLIHDVESCHTHDIDECANVKFVDHIEFTAERGFDNRPQDDQEHAARHA